MGRRRWWAFLLAVLGVFCEISGVYGCSGGTTLSQVNLYFYEHKLGPYTVYLKPTLSAIESGEVSSGAPYFEKPWYGDCPAGLRGDACMEYTVYPNYPGHTSPVNFSPNVADAIEKWTHGVANRGEVRVITDASQSQYVYTINHERTFCGPYAMP